MRVRLSLPAPRHVFLYDFLFILPKSKIALYAISSIGIRALDYESRGWEFESLIAYHSVFSKLFTVNKKNRLLSHFEIC